MLHLLVGLGVPESEPGDRIGGLARARGVPRGTGTTALSAVARTPCSPDTTRRGPAADGDDVVILNIGPAFPGRKPDLGPTSVPGNASRKQLWTASATRSPAARLGVQPKAASPLRSSTTS